MPNQGISVPLHVSTAYYTGKLSPDIQFFLDYQKLKNMSHKTISSVVIAGGTGRLGPPTIKHLLKNGFEVSVLTRNSSLAKLPPEVDVIGADHSSAETLSPSLVGHGFDAIVITLNRVAYDASVVTMQAAVNAGIYRAIPSFFGVSLDNPEIANMPFMKTKLPVLNHVLAKAEKGEITYTGINTGMFLDWALEEDIFVGISGKAPTRVADGGDIPMSATTLDDIGKAICAVLLNPDETINKLYYIHTVVMTQNQVLGYAHEAAPGAEFAVEQVDTKVLAEAAWRRYNEGIRDRVSVRDFVIRASYGMGNGFFPKTDNEVLGIRQRSDEELKEEIFRRVKATSLDGVKTAQLHIMLRSSSHTLSAPYSHYSL